MFAFNWRAIVWMGMSAIGGAPSWMATVHDPDCVKTLRGITAPRILSPLVMRRAKKRSDLHHLPRPHNVPAVLGMVRK
jgi:hypothetical protein